MYPLDNVWINCLKNLNVTSMSPLDKYPLAPSDTRTVDPATLVAIPDPPEYEAPPRFWDGVVLEERVVDPSVPPGLGLQ